MALNKTCLDNIILASQKLLYIQFFYYLNKLFILIYLIKIKTVN